MRPSILLSVATATVLTFAITACGGDKAPRGGGEAKPSANQEELVSASALLKQSAERTSEVTTMSGSFSMDIEMGGQEYSTSGDMVATPDSMHMSMRVLGNETEFLMISRDIYMRFGDDWYLIDSDEFGFDPKAFEQYLENRGIVDFDDLADKLQDAEQLPNDDIDGKPFAHYHGQFDYAELLKDPSANQIITDDMRAMLEGSEGTVLVDTWIDPDSLLPRRIVMDMDVRIDSLDQDMSMTMTMDFLEFNGEVEIPDRPADAPSISELAGE